MTLHAVELPERLGLASCTFARASSSGRDLRGAGRAAGTSIVYTATNARTALPRPAAARFAVISSATRASVTWSTIVRYSISIAGPRTFVSANTVFVSGRPWRLR